MLSNIAKSPFERLQEVSDEFEIWWDSSPLVYSTWKEKYLESIPEDKKAKFSGWLERLYNEQNPEKSVFRGVTTNPRLTRETLDWIPEVCTPWIKEIKTNTPILLWKSCTLDDIHEDNGRRGKEVLPILKHPTTNTVMSAPRWIPGCLLIRKRC